MNLLEDENSTWLTKLFGKNISGFILLREKCIENKQNNNVYIDNIGY